MFANVLRNLLEYLQTVPAMANRAHSALLVAVFTSMLVIWVMGAFNIYGFKGVNLVLMLIVTPIVAWQFFNPTWLAAAGGAGVVWSGLLDSDKTRGATKGVIAFLKLGILITFGFALMSLTLATWELGSWKAFGYITGGALVAGLAVLFLELKGKTIGWMGLLYGIVVVVTGTLQSPTMSTITTKVGNPVEWVAGTKTFSDLGSNERSRSSEIPYTEFDLRYVEPMTATQEGEPLIREMSTAGTAWVKTGNAMTPNVYESCPKVVSPKLPVDVYFESVAGNGTSENFIKLTKKSQKDLLEYGITRITVAFIKILRPRSDALHCQAYQQGN